jgi:hypothetical protein
VNILFVHPVESAGFSLEWLGVKDVGFGVTEIPLNAGS